MDLARYDPSNGLIYTAGRFSIGNTSRVVDLYRLLGVLRELARWTEGGFRTWFADHVLPADDAEAAGDTGG